MRCERGLCGAREKHPVSTVCFCTKNEGTPVSVLSTAHRATGMRVPRRKILGSKTKRELGGLELYTAIQSVSAAAAPLKSLTARMV